MYEGYLALAGVEIINNERTVAYARNLGITPIDCLPCSIAEALGHEAYKLPAEDEGCPWFDPAAPESAGFAGFYALSVQGFSSSPITRSTLERLSDGAVITRSRYNHREVQYNGVLLANSQCSLSYGMAWLSTALRGSNCEPCSGTEACAYTCCPTVDTEEETVRTMAEVAILAGPTTDRVAKLRSAGLIAEVNFTLVLGRPWLYRAPVQVAVPERMVMVGCGEFNWRKTCESYASWTDLSQAFATWQSVGREACIDWSKDIDECRCPTEGSAACMQDPIRPPDCPEPPAPPSVPRPYDPCSICYDGPETMTGSINVPPQLTPMWLDQVPLVEIRTGESPARAILLRFHANPTGREEFCELSQLDRCTACATMAIPYIPPGSMLTIDGRDSTAWLDCAGGRRTAVFDDAAGIYGPDGRPYTWPVFDCNGFCVSLTVPCDFPIDEVDITVSVVAREDAA